VNVGRPTFKGYAENIEAKTGRSLAEFWRQAISKGFVRNGKVVAEYSEMMKWFKSEAGLGHVHASFMVMYLRLRAGDSKVSPAMRKWAYSTGYRRG